MKAILAALLSITLTVSADDARNLMRDIPGPNGATGRAIAANPAQDGESAEAYRLRIERAVAIEGKKWSAKDQKAYLVRVKELEAKEAEERRLAVEAAKLEEMARIRRAAELRR